MKRFAYEEARSLGERVLDVIEPLVVGAEVAGSVRRRRTLVHDVDVVLIPNALTFPAMIASRIREELGGNVTKSGPKMLQMIVLNRQVDLIRDDRGDLGRQPPQVDGEQGAQHQALHPGLEDGDEARRLEGAYEGREDHRLPNRGGDIRGPGAAVDTA